MIEWITSNIDKILIAIGAAVVLFWPQIKKQIAALQGNGEQPNGQKQVPPCCCCPEEPHHDDADKSQWVVRTMETRAYCVDHRLEEGVELCEKLVGVLVASKPKVASVTVTRVEK
jgi:hypothetical protein